MRLVVCDLPTEVLARVLRQHTTIKEQIEARSVCFLFRQAVTIALAQRESISTLHIGQLCVLDGYIGGATLKQVLVAYHNRAEIALQWLIPRCTGLIDVKLNAGSCSSWIHPEDSASHSSITDTTAQLLANHCMGLRFLALRCPRVSDRGVLALAHSCQALVAVDLSHTGIAVNGLTELLRRCTKLRHINVSSTRIGTVAVTDAFIGLNTKLRSVDISDNPIEDSCAEVVAAACADLERINLSGGGTLESMRIGDEAVESFTKRCGHLRHIDVSYSEVSLAGRVTLEEWAAAPPGPKTFLVQQYEE